LSEHATIFGKPGTAASQPEAKIVSSQKENGHDFYNHSLRNQSIQCKLSIGAVDDPLEQEADAMADTVMRMPDTPFIQRKCHECEEEEKLQKKPVENSAGSLTDSAIHMPGDSFIQRKCAECEEEKKLQRKPLASFIQKKSVAGQVLAADAMIGKIQASQCSGSCLPDAQRSFMETRFGTSFSDVKIHTGDYAVQLSRELNAQAFTIGNNIYFNHGKYAPETNKGKHLLAHELAHTIQQGASHSIQRKGEENKDTIETRDAPGNIKVKRTIVPGECKVTKNSSSSLTGDFKNNKLLFEAKGCKNNVTGEAYGDLDFGEFVDGAGKFVKSLGSNILSGDVGGKLTDELNKDFKDEKLKASLRLVLRVGSFRAEIQGTGGVSASKNGDVGVNSFIRYANGRFNIELGGGFREVWEQGQQKGEGTFHLYTDAGPIIIRIEGKHGATGTSVEGKIGDSDISKNHGIGFTYSDINGEKKVVFNFTFTLPEKIPTETAPDCVYCGCEKPQILFECTDETRKPPPDIPKLETQYIPLYYSYSLTTPRNDKDFPAGEYEKTVQTIIGYIENGYIIDHIAGYTSPEGRLEGRPGGFEGNRSLSLERANKAAEDIKKAIAAKLGKDVVSLLFDAHKVRDYLTAANSQAITTVGENEVHGADQTSGDIPESKLFSHLSKDLKAPDPGEEDILEKERIIGPALPEELRDIASQDISSFRTGKRDKRILTHDQRLQLLYPWLRKALVILRPPAPDLSRIDLSIGVLSNKIIPCTDEHRKLFSNAPIPAEDKLFIDKCSSKAKPK
jgi:hypothetical protein